MLGLIGAMDVEVNALKNAIKNKSCKTVASIEFVTGELENKQVCVAQCSPGKVNAALCTQAMIDNFDIEKIINIGVGCSLYSGVCIKDIVVAAELCQYDFDTSATDGVKGLVLNGKTSIETDCVLSDELAAVAEQSGAVVHRGCIATGDTFIASNELKAEINREFGAICGEMEGGAIAQVCYINKVPFTVLRTISDGGDENAQMDYPSFKEVAAKISCEIIMKYLRG